MILEALETLATPCPAYLRRLGYRAELVAIGARYRRCRAAWAEHLARSRRAIERTIERTSQRRTAIVLGSGRLLDVPLAQLAAAFARVVLVDAVHPLPARLRARRFANVELRSADVGGVLQDLTNRRPDEPLPPPQPFAALHEPDVDLVVSLNLLSQLGVLPEEWLERHGTPGDTAHRFAARLTQAHLDDLARCRAAVCLITDIERLWLSSDGKVVDRDGSIYGVAPPDATEEWLWRIAPAPESDPVLSEERRVIVAEDPGK